jgi:hypothetical protein
MENQLRDSFVYIWIDTFLGKQYIGCHKRRFYKKGGEKLSSKEYVSSSKYFLEEYQKRPMDFIRLILGEYDSFEEAREIEERLLTWADAAKNPLFYNRHNGDGKAYNKNISELHKQKISKALKGRPGIIPSEESREKMRLAQLGEKNHNFGKPKSEKIKEKMRKTALKMTKEHKKKLSEGKKGSKNPMYGKSNSGVNHPCYGTTLSDEHKKAIGNASRGRNHSIESKKKQSESMKAIWAKKKLIDNRYGRPNG